MNSGYDLDQLLQAALIRWLKPVEVLFILKNHEKLPISHEAPQMPPSGSLFLFNRKVLPSFRKDGHNWIKKRDGMSVKEAHERLMVGNAVVLECYYTRVEEVNRNFQRRTYLMPNPAYEHIVLVHYLDIREGKPNYVSGSEFKVGSSYIHDQSATSLSGLSGPYQSLSSPVSIEASSRMVDENQGIEHFDNVDCTGMVWTSPEIQVGYALPRLEKKGAVSLTDIHKSSSGTVQGSSVVVSEGQWMDKEESVSIYSNTEVIYAPQKFEEQHSLKDGHSKVYFPCENQNQYKDGCTVPGFDSVGIRNLDQEVAKQQDQLCVANSGQVFSPTNGATWQGKGTIFAETTEKLVVKKETSPQLSSQEEDTLVPADITLDEMKECGCIFFLLSKDYEFEKDILIELWMAGGCIKSEPLEQHGQKCLEFLLREGYILCSGTNFVTRRDRYRMNIKKINALLNGQQRNSRFFLKWGNEYQHNITNSAEIQHLSLVCNDIDASTFQRLRQFNELKTLLFLGSYGHRVQKLPDHLFWSLRKLQALDLSRTHIKKLPSSVGCMIHLCYLNLSETLIEWLPDIICSLTELQTLKLKGCSNLRGLPGQLKRLTKLRHLDVDVLRQLATMPKGIGSLANLRTLSAFLVGTEDGCKIQELKELNNLTGEFCIAMLEHVGSGHEAREAMLNSKIHVKKLELRWTMSQSSRMDNESDGVLECLRPCSSLEELQVLCYQGSTFPHWVCDPVFDQLVNITFFNCENVLELPLVEQLPSLKHLELVKMNGIKKIERRGNLEHVAFSRLEKLEIDEMQSLEAWSWAKTDDGDYKCLVEITIKDCSELQEFDVLPCLSSVKHLEIRECPQLLSLSDKKLPDSLEHLIVEDCPRIRKKFSPHGGEDWYKIQHVPNICIGDEDGYDDDDDDS